MILRRAAERFVTDQAGIRTWHAFSAGAHYDPSNVSFGSVIGCDEHLVDPGKGFDWHAHRGVVIVSWVLEGVLRHEDDRGAELLISAGGVLVQSTGDGIRHRETNPSDLEPLRLVQMTLLLDLSRSVQRPDLPARFSAVDLDVLRAPGPTGPAHVVVGTAGCSVDGIDLGPGDTLRLDGPHDIVGSGDCLVIALRDRSP